MHIGMIGGIGPAATEFYYRNLVELFGAAQQSLDLTIVHAEAIELVSNIEAGLPFQQAILFKELSQRLESAGAEVIVISSIAGHFCLPEFEKKSALPIVSVIPCLESDLISSGFRRVALIGNRISMETKLFGGIKSIDVVTPLGKELDAVHDAYVRIATTGQVDCQQRDLLFSSGRDLCENQGAEAVVLAGTDLFLAFDGYDCGFRTVDSALVHIESVFKLATGQ